MHLRLVFVNCFLGHITFSAPLDAALVEDSWDIARDKSTTAQFSERQVYEEVLTLRHAGPDILMIAIADLPGAVESAYMVQSSSLINVSGLVLSSLIDWASRKLRLVAAFLKSRVEAYRCRQGFEQPGYSEYIGYLNPDIGALKR